MVCVIGLAVGLLAFARIVRPGRPGPVTRMPYESGMDPIHDTRRRFDVRFYLLAIAFLVFDVELLFLYPWAVVAGGMGTSVPIRAASAIGNEKGRGGEGETGRQGDEQAANRRTSRSLWLPVSQSPRLPVSPSSFECGDEQSPLGLRRRDDIRGPVDPRFRVRLAERGISMAVAELPDNVAVTKLDELVSWCRKNSLWPMPFATACCGIELMAVGASRHDIARFGAEVFRFSPRQCDLMIVAGRIVMKMLPVLQRIWQQMPEPKWCISMGACASTGGVFDTYCVVQGIDRFIPVDMYVPGCPPRPEQLIQSIIDLQEKIQREGTIYGREFAARSRQEPKRALQDK